MPQYGLVKKPHLYDKLQFVETKAECHDCHDRPKFVDLRDRQTEVRRTIGRPCNRGLLCIQFVSPILFHSVTNMTKRGVSLLIAWLVSFSPLAQAAAPQEK